MVEAKVFLHNIVAVTLSCLEVPSQAVVASVRARCRDPLIVNGITFFIFRSGRNFYRK